MKEIAEPQFNQAYLQQLTADILQETRRQGVTAAEVDISMNKGFTVNARKCSVESVEYHKDKIIEITVYLGKRTGSASLSDIRPEAVKSAVEAACNIARFTDEDPCSGLAEKDLLAFNFPKLELAYPWNITVQEAIEMACECERQALSADKRIVNSEGTSITTSDSWHAYGNTEGFVGIFPVTRHEISCVLIAKQDEEMQRDYFYTMAADPQLLKPIDYVAQHAAERTVSRLGSRNLSTRKAPVIFFSEEPARGLLGHFVAAISGGSLYRKSSFLLDKIDQPIFPSHVQIGERPHLVKGLGSAPFDNDGVLTRPNIFIQEGILRNYCLSVYSARKLGLKTTGNAGGVHNLFINTSDHDLPALLKKMDKGLLVTEMMGNGVNLVTGDYSRGASGFWVENGEIQYPVEEITIAGNLKDIYGNLVEVANDVDSRGNIMTGSILIEEMMIAGE